MKKIILSLLTLFLFIPVMVVNASSANISVSSSNTVMVGNNVTVTVTLSGKNGSKLGGWQANLSYDTSLLKLTSASTEGGGTRMAGYATSATGVSSKKYTFTFKALKSGSAKVAINSFSIWDFDENVMTATGASKTISIKTKEEIEATYSSNAYLKSITVGEYPLSPAFNKDTLEYEVEVPNEIESVNVSASKEDGASSVTGTGNITLTEGNNKVTIVVTAQKGNTKNYVVNINRKELDPINVTIEGNDFTIVRRSDALPEYLTFKPATTNIEGTEVPALYSEITGFTLVGLKKNDGEIHMYLVEDGKVTTEYAEIKSEAMTLYPLDLPKNDLFKNYIKKEIEVNGIKVNGYFLTDNSKFAIIYAQDVTGGDTNYYSYNTKDNTTQVFDKELIENYEEKLTTYKYVFLGLIGFIVILLFILIIRKPKKKKNKKIETKPELVKTIEKHIDEEIQDEVQEIRLIEKTQNIPIDKEENIEETQMSKKEQKRLEKKKKKNGSSNY